MTEPMKELCVAHLIRGQNGIKTFIRFIESYRQNPGGIDHDLLVIFKGFNSPDEKKEYLRLLAPFKYATLDVPDIGFDITAYFTVVKRFAAQYRYFCFLNSSSEILDHEWLSKLHKHISQPEVGLAGATGSCESRRSQTFTLQDIFDVARHHYRLHKNKSFWKRTILGGLGAWHHCQSVGAWDYFLTVDVWDYFLSQVCFDPFPNCHLRTNAFIISSQTMSDLKCPLIQNKMDAYRFESGKNGLTTQILRKGKRVIVVGRNGLSYDKGAWDASNTYRISEQENLLVADNQTRDYQCSIPERREFLSSITWENKSHLSREDAG